MLRALIALFVLTLVIGAHATTRLSDFPDHSRALKSWFKMAQPTPAAHQEFGIYYCCEQAERVKTKFSVLRDNEGGEKWFLQCVEETMVYCKQNGKSIDEFVQIPSTIIHTEGIDTPTQYINGDGTNGLVGDDERKKVELEFQQLRSEGVLFVFNHNLVCFWPPDFQG